MYSNEFVDSSKFNINIYTEIMNVLDNNIYKGIFCDKNIINTILFSYRRKIKLVDLIDIVKANLVQQTDIRMGNLYNFIFKLLIKEYKNKNYKILNESRKDSIIEVDCFTSECLEVDLLFEEVGENNFNLFELKTRNNQDTGKKKIMVLSFKKLIQKFTNKLGNLFSAIVYIEEDTTDNINLNLDSEYIMTGKEFFKKYLDMDIDKLFNTINNIVNRFDTKSKMSYAEKVFEDFFEHPMAYKQYVTKENYDMFEKIVEEKKNLTNNK